VRPASYVQYEDGEWNQRRYWSFSFGSRTDSRYVSDLAAAYTDAVSAVMDTTPDTPGLWLSGGLDSRILAATLASEGLPFRAYTYDRPLEHEFDPFVTSIELAKRVSNALGVEHRTVDFGPGTLLERIPELVDITAGQVGWNTVVNLSAAFEVDAEEAPVMMEGSVPIVCGEHVWASYLDGSSHPADALYDMHARRDAGAVKDVLAGDVEPKDTFIDEALAAPHTGRNNRILAATHMNYNSRKHFTNNKVARARLGTREFLASGDLLDVIGDMPAAYRTQTVPFTGGRIPHVPSKLKLWLLREQDGDLADIPYEGTQLPPSYPHLLHGAGFVAKNAIQRILSSSALDNWYRERNDFRAVLDDLLDSAARRDVFDREGIERVRASHLSGDADRIGFIAPITTVELFMQRVLGR
jgi:asparagine synthase (glutamine-hydrolysing)